MKRIVIITGFEAFNASLYRNAAQKAIARCPNLEVLTFNDRDLASQPEAVAQALQGADVFFASLIFDYDQVIWLRERVENIPVRLVFESALELMALTRLGKFVIGEQPKGMPKPIKFILSKFTNSKEEDKLAGYLSFLKTGPKLLKYIPAKKVQDLRNWLIIYGYWNAGGTDNVAAMCWAIAENYLGLNIGELPAVVETPNLGLLHPDHDGYFLSPQAYLDWHRHTFPEQKLNPIVAVLLYRKHVVTKQPYIPQLIRKFEADGLVPLPIFINGVEAHVIVRDWLTTDYEQHQRLHGQVEIKSLKADAVKVEGIVSTIGFPLVGGPAGSMEAGRQVEVAKSILSAKNIPYLVAAPLLIQDLHSWTRQGIGGLQSVVLYALPELDGAIDTIPLGGLVGEDIYLIPERVKRLTGRLKNWIRLKNTAPGDRQLAILLYGFPPGYGATGTAALLNVPKSLVNLLKTLQAQGYDVGDFPEDGEEIIRLVKAADEAYRLDPALVPQQTLENIDLKTMDRWLGYLLTQKIEKQWQSLTNTGLKTFGGKCQVGGVQFGKVWIGVQPPLGISGDPMRLMFEKDLTPHPQYAAFYKWLQNEFRADALIHFGMHGTVEWLPGSPLGNTSYSWSDILLGNLPNLYIYAANNPSESILAKRRGYGTLISHNVPPYGRAGLYKELLVLRDLIGEYREDPEKNDALRPDIIQKIIDLGLPEDCPFTVGQEQGIAFTVANAPLFSKTALQNYFVQIYEYLQTLEQRLFSSGLHVLGEKPSPAIIQSYLAAYFGDRLSANILTKVAQGEPEITCDQPELLAEAREIGDRLLQTDDEITNLLKGLNGEYLPPAPGGDLLRDGLGVLPTGRNIHALDPYRMPSPAAYARGREIGKKIIQQHLEETGNYPETVAVMLWGLDAIKTKGESLGILLELVGAKPIKEGTGRIVRYELLPLAVVGHPRIDILANLSGIFRDSFVNIIELLDDLFHRAATVDEDPAQNFIRKHSLELQAEGVENTTARLFSNPAGDFGSLVNDQIVEGNWDNSDELAKTWEGRNQYSYGRNDKGQARPEVLKKLLQTGDRLVQEIDSVEYGLTDIQEYYANTGGLKKAAENASGKTVTASFVESFSKDTTPRKLESVLRMEYRSKLLNPKWAEAMADQGSGGAYEISQRMTALIGWGGTVDFQDQWVYDQAAETYALDTTMAQKLREANPEAFRNIVGRMLEAHGRGFWEASDEKLQKLSDLYDLTDDVLEGITV
ncbi:magnesium chelatase subunit H [Picosynechococcus sp. PCC 73109]|uniref:magnesium chelatase subunit H n=1 Tax=Picosynechococcus sp. PCC 73109 TaxID=374982 RepID=UPI000745824B|nr:magnesium chelatase subunit H [Picosynechococcus sp. PCC 73109]AMA08753.1 protoporphyrin IX magnesium chelatase [Picosynechococcus sp. PCC 73109]